MDSNFTLGMNRAQTDTASSPAELKSSTSTFSDASSHSTGGRRSAESRTFTVIHQCSLGAVEHAQVSEWIDAVNLGRFAGGVNGVALSHFSEKDLKALPPMAQSAFLKNLEYVKTIQQQGSVKPVPTATEVAFQGSPGEFGCYPNIGVIVK